MTVEKLLELLKELDKNGMGEYTVVDDNGDDIEEVVCVLSNNTKLVVVRNA